MMERLLDEKDQIHLSQGYAQGRLSSPFIEMRRTQLKWISHSYLVANMLVILELIILFATKDEGFGNCSRLCAQPYSNGASVYLLMLAICHLVPTHLFLYSFYIIPRRFYVSEDSEDVKVINDIIIFF